MRDTATRMFYIDNVRGFAQELELPEDIHLLQSMLDTDCVEWPTIYLDDYPFRVLTRRPEKGYGGALKDGSGLQVSGARAMIFGSDRNNYPRDLNDFEADTLRRRCRLFVSKMDDGLRLGYEIRGFSRTPPQTRL